jgi:hypothetical protein
MKCRIVRTIVVFFVLALSPMILQTALAQDYKTLTPLLTDLPGWTAEKAEGASMNMGDMKMLHASRNYTKGDKELTAVIMVGSTMMTQGQLQQMTVESQGVKMQVSDINGFKVHNAYDKNDKSGTITVFLAQGKTQGAVLVFSYTHLTESEGLNLVKTFDWKKIKDAVEKLL